MFLQCEDSGEIFSIQMQIAVKQQMQRQYTYK